MITTKPVKMESPSKRLRSVIYLQWIKEDTDIDQQKFYEDVMEEILIEQKAKL